MEIGKGDGGEALYDRYKHVDEIGHMESTKVQTTSHAES